MLEDWVNNKEVNYRILIYPNITHRQIEKDSYIDLLPSILSYLNKLRDDLHFTLFLPKELEVFNLPNVEQKVLPLPTSPNRMRTHFDSEVIRDLIEWKTKDWDIIYSHLPEHTLQLVNLFWNSTHHQPKVIGYLHWLETNESMSNRAKNMFLQNINGVLQMEELGVNSLWLKEYILNKCSEFYNDKTLQRLDKIIQPHYLGITDIDYSDTKHSKSEVKKIIFNHRHNNYTGYNWLVRCLDKLYEQRKDFRVYTTMGDMDRDYAERLKTKTKSEYLSELKDMYIGIGSFKKYSAWSLSVTDGLSRGIPYLLPNDLVYAEMVGDRYPLLYENDEDNFLALLNNVLDKPQLRNSARDYIEPMMEQFLWDKRISKWFGGWNSIFDGNNYSCSKTDGSSYKKVIKYISEKKYATKSEVYKMLGWGVTFTFSGIRNSLRNDKRIKLTSDGYEWNNIKGG